ncbi:hypothetical protein [Mycobacterium sp. EPa45]|uniref:hypothetical protein n=1 Tax=Mycobacterium sp. EPa45 TaxID=1545728 RepID=UPI000642786A|nr:hypothetical protein [Mycobacterium sp. EPa45]AKK29892.1 hypothetical protein AB431_28020 [Mycobacterium sp. EPa45]
MDHTIKGRPLAGAVAAAAATAVMLTTTTFAPPQPNVAALSPRISIEEVQLAALPAVLTSTSPKTTGAGVVANDLADSWAAIPQAITMGIGAGVFGGFIIGGLLAGNIVSQIPVIGPALMPVVPIAAVIGALVGIPIGAVVGTFYAIQNLVSSLAPAPPSPPSPPVASARPAAASRNTITTPQRSVKSGTRSNRHTAKSALPAKATAPQQDSIRSRAGSGRGHVAASNRADRH